MTAARSALGWSGLRGAYQSGARVGLWGLGREGQASLRKLRALAIAAVLVDDVPNAPGVLPTAAGGLDALKSCDVVLKTPGISRYRPEAEELRKAGVTLTGGLALWLNEADAGRVVLVTGTKGKSTTCAIAGHLLTGLGLAAMVGGNFGTAPYDPAAAADDYDFWVIEVSSYTATDLAVTPPVTAVTSLHPDHLPWHGTVERYYADKLSACSQPGARLTIANGDSDLLRARAALLAPRVEWVSESDDPDATWLAPLAVPGRHNRRNALIARQVLRALGVPGADDDDRVAAAAAGFAPLPSRLATVGEIAGVTFVDDSLSTNVLPALAALDAFPGRRVALIVGGQDRGIDYVPLAEGVKARQDPTFVLTLPDCGPRITRAFTAAPSPATGEGKAADGLAGVRDCQDLDAAVAEAFAWARPDGVVLLSPAAPSFGRFRDYADRATHFTAAMRACANLP